MVNFLILFFSVSVYSQNDFEFMDMNKYLLINLNLCAEKQEIKNWFFGKIMREIEGYFWMDIFITSARVSTVNKDRIQISRKTTLKIYTKQISPREIWPAKFESILYSKRLKMALSALQKVLGIAATDKMIFWLWSTWFIVFTLN